MRGPETPKVETGSNTPASTAQAQCRAQVASIQVGPNFREDALLLGRGSIREMTTPNAARTSPHSTLSGFLPRVWAL